MLCITEKQMRLYSQTLDALKAFPWSLVPNQLWCGVSYDYQPVSSAQTFGPGFWLSRDQAFDSALDRPRFCPEWCPQIILSLVSLYSKM